MKRLLLGLTLLVAFFSTANAQRCGSAMNISFLDKSGKAIEGKSRYQVRMKSYNDKLVDSEALIKNGTLQEKTTKIKQISFRTMCGIIVAEFEVSYKGEKMTLKIRRIPGDIDFSIVAPKFAKGVFEIDLNNDYKNFRKPEAKEGETFAGSALVSELKWKKIE